MKALNSRLQEFTESVIRGMTRLANKHGAINLSQGFPDFDPPPELTRALGRVSENGPHQYAVTWGAPRFREALARKQERFMGLPLDPETNFVVTCGSTEAMMVAMMTVCNPGDKVAIFSPFYENYTADAILSGADPIYIPLVPPDYRFSSDRLRGAFEQGAKALVLCNPSNPTGKVFEREELESIAKLAVEFDAYVITDEVYEHMVYAPARHTYMASLPGMAERTLSCSSLSKTYSITGWRLGYLIASPAIIGEARKIHDFLTVGAAAPLQEAAVAGLELPDTYYEKLASDYQKRRDLFTRGLNEAGLHCEAPAGAYYVMVDISRFGFESDLAFCEWLVEKIGVAAVPGSSFFREDEHRYVRFHFAKKQETLDAALERLRQLRSYA